MIFHDITYLKCASSYFSLHFPHLGHLSVGILRFCKQSGGRLVIKRIASTKVEIEHPSSLLLAGIMSSSMVPVFRLWNLISSMTGSDCFRNMSEFSCTQTVLCLLIFLKSHEDENIPLETGWSKTFKYKVSYLTLNRLYRMSYHSQKNSWLDVMPLISLVVQMAYHEIWRI